MAPTQFVNVVTALQKLEQTGKDYNEVMDKITGDLNESFRGASKLLDEKDAAKAEELFKEYQKQRKSLMKATAKGPLTKHLFSTKDTASLTQPEKLLLKEFLSGEDTLLTEADLKEAGVKLDSAAGKNLLGLIGKGYKFPKVLTVNTKARATEKEVTAANIQKFFKEFEADDRFNNSRDWFVAHRLKSNTFHESYAPFREEVSKKVIKMPKSRATAPQQQPKPTGGGVRGKEGTSTKRPITDDEEKKMQEEEEIEKARAEAAAAMRKEMAKEKEKESEGSGSKDEPKTLRQPKAVPKGGEGGGSGDPPKPVDISRSAALEKATGKSLRTGTEPRPPPGAPPPEEPATSSASAGPVSDGEKRLASKGLIENPKAAAEAADEAAEELKRAQMEAITAFKTRETRQGHLGKGPASRGVRYAPTLDTIEDVNESIAADIEESEANRNEAAKTLQTLARLRSKANAARAYTKRLRQEQADAAKPDFTNLSTRVSQREAGAPKVSTLPPATQAERIPGTSEAGTDTAPVENLVMENVSRGREEDTPGVGQIMKSAGTSEKDDDKEVARLSIEGAKDRIRALHTVFDELIPAFKSAPHRKDRDDALQSKDEKVVKKHLLSMLKKVREYYSGGPSGLRVGVVIPAQAIIQSLLGGAAAAAPAAPVVAAPAPAAAPFGMGGRTPDHPGSVIHKKGSDPYGVGMSIAIHRRNSGMASFMKKGVAGHAITNVEPIQPGKVSKPVIKMNQNAPMNGNMGIVLGRTPKSLGIKIKTGKR